MDFWPRNNGFLVIDGNMSLDPGYRFSRYGGYFDGGVFKDGGRYVAPEGVPFENRALPANSLLKPYTVYEVVKQIPDIPTGPAIPWFGQPGFGPQHQLPKPLQYYLDNGYIRVVSQHVPPSH
jgi:hypothetical protein